MAAAPDDGFAWMLVNFRDRDLLVWQCGMLHAVLGARRADIVRVKVLEFVELSESGVTRAQHCKVGKPV